MEKYLSSGGSRGGGGGGGGGPAPPPPAYFQTKLRPEGPKINFGDSPPPPLSVISRSCSGAAKVYQTFLFMGHAFSKKNGEYRIKLLGSTSFLIVV